MCPWPAFQREAAQAYGNDPLPTPAEALAEPFSAFPSWFLRIECDRCGKVRMVNEVHAPWRVRTLHDILARMRHDGCGGLAGKTELLTGVQGVSSESVQRIVLRGDPTAPAHRAHRRWTQQRRSGLSSRGRHNPGGTDCIAYSRWCCSPS